MARSVSLACALAVACLGLVALCGADYPSYGHLAPHYAVHDPYVHVNRHYKTRNVKIIDDIFTPLHHGYHGHGHGYPGHGYPGHGYHGYGDYHYGYPGYGYHGYGSHYDGYPSYGHHGYGKQYYGFPGLKSVSW